MKSTLQYSSLEEIKAWANISASDRGKRGYVFEMVERVSV